MSEEDLNAAVEAMDPEFIELLMKLDATEDLKLRKNMAKLATGERLGRIKDGRLYRNSARSSFAEWIRTEFGRLTCEIRILAKYWKTP